MAHGILTLVREKTSRALALAASGLLSAERLPGPTICRTFKNMVRPVRASSTIGPAVELPPFFLKP